MTAMSPTSIDRFDELKLEGEFHTSDVLRRLYATDASEYQELPVAVAAPKSEADIHALVRYAFEHRLGLIPRTAGTSLAGQCVGNGIVVDCSRFMTRILEIDPVARRVRVQPGVVRNELNLALLPHGLLFGPETSTANRAMMGGMVGNNSCCSNSVVYGSTRQHLISARGFLSDGSEVVFGPLNREEFQAKCDAPDSLETRIYREIRDILGEEGNRTAITENYPKRSIPRRNTGYALDLLMDCSVFDPASEKPFNFCQLIAGSEGTLFFGVEFEFSCDPLPPKHAALLVAHFTTVDDSLHATLLALEEKPSAVELIDRHILECTKASLEHAKNRFFLVGDPGAILVIELRRDTEEELQAALKSLESRLREAGRGYAYPILRGEEGARVWELRRAGQGLMSNVPGDAKPREIVEDTAVAVRDMPAYISEFDGLMRDKYGISCVYYAHAGSGELHTRPLFELKTAAGVKQFRDIATDIAHLVKRYGGSLSGEHGDGRLRGEFIPLMVGEFCYGLMRRVKVVFDPRCIFNPHKIIDTPPMDTQLKHPVGKPTPEYETVFDFSSTLGIVRAAEQCTGSGDCRKSQLMGGTMCPSYMATRNEKDTTRARANILRQMLIEPPDPRRPFDSPEVKEIFDLCLSCKGCKNECPSNVDIGKMKAEFLQQYYDLHGVPLRARLISEFAAASRVAALAPGIWNAIFGNETLRRAANKVNGFHPDRTIPLLHETTLEHWFRRRQKPAGPACNGRVLIFCDEFSNFQDVPVGIAMVELLEALGYEVDFPRHAESGRAAMSKGLLRKARRFASENVRLLGPLVSESTPLIGIEPSAILCFRDEYPDLLRGEEQKQARALGKLSFLFEEFIAREMDAGRITSDSFHDRERVIKLHGHCHQKALSSLTPSVRALELPRGYKVQLIPSGCCGMAGSFGYEVEHYPLSMQIGELVLFPTIRQAPSEVIIAAPGTSCRHQIHDGTGRTAKHPAQILRAALRRNE